MGTQAAPPRGATALRSWLLPLCLAGALTAGCGGVSGAGAGHGAAPPSPRTTSPEELCARIVAHWSRAVLDGDTYGDYQSMGLSNGQYEILRRVVATARTVKRREGAAAAEASIDRGARAGCADRYRRGGAGKGPWQ
ncbi:hypothetical protein [Streptomyces mexicanus]|uniref:hypothetical protein n=1 Tax=Streptomyces mexicanus TaxID=178566 RepID=UPI0031ED0725